MIKDLTSNGIVADDKKPFPIQVLGDRVMVLPLMEDSDIEEIKSADGQITFKKKGTSILLSDREVQDEKFRRQNTLAKCLVISVGDLNSGETGRRIITTLDNIYITNGSIVYCFPTTQDAKMMIDSVEYWIYKEKAIVAKEI